MTKKRRNPLLSFYRDYKVAPNSQDISDFGRHLKRREKLYRLLGLAPISFSGKRILEIGPGGGHNSLVFLKWQANVDFAEPNPRAQKELVALMKKHRINKKRWNLFLCKGEDIKCDRKYEIVIAEGVIPGMNSRKKLISKISSLVTPGGVVVVTCRDEIAIFFEIIRRMLGHYLLKTLKVNNFQDKIEVLSKAFSSHFNSLQFATRLPQDWVLDTFLNPGIYGKLFNFVDCIAEFGKEFSLLGSSPHMFTDYSWYKDTQFDQQSSIADQYNAKKHTLILHDIIESVRSVEANNELADTLSKFLRFCMIAERNLDRKNVNIIIRFLEEIIDLTRDIDVRIQPAIEESIQLLLNNDLNIEKIALAKELMPLFGRALPYASLVKNL